MKFFLTLFLAALCTFQGSAVQAKPRPPQTVEIYFDNWKEVDGVKYPFFISQKFPKLTLTYSVKEIRHNVPVDARVFAAR